MSDDIPFNKKLDLVPGRVYEVAPGVRRVLELLLADLNTALALAGAPCASELDRSWIQRAPWAASY